MDRELYLDPYDPSLSCTRYQKQALGHFNGQMVSANKTTVGADNSTQTTHFIQGKHDVFLLCWSKENTSSLFWISEESDYFPLSNVYLGSFDHPWIFNVKANIMNFSGDQDVGCLYIISLHQVWAWSVHYYKDVVLLSEITAKKNWNIRTINPPKCQYREISFLFLECWRIR